MGMLMIFNAYSQKDLQHVYQVLVQLDHDGVSGIKEAISILDKHIFKEQKGAVVSGKLQLDVCPGCSVGLLVGPYLVDGTKIVRCSKKCGYSEVI